MNFTKKRMKKSSLNYFLNRLFPFVIVSRKEYQDLNHFVDTTVGLYAIDRNPEDVDNDWILKNNVRIKDLLPKGDSKRIGEKI